MNANIKTKRSRSNHPWKQLAPSWIFRSSRRYETWAEPLLNQKWEQADKKSESGKKVKSESKRYDWKLSWAASQSKVAWDMTESEKVKVKMKVKKWKWKNSKRYDWNLSWAASQSKVFQTGKTSARVDSPGTSSSHAPRISMKRGRKTVIVLCLDRGLKYHNY